MRGHRATQCGIVPRQRAARPSAAGLRLLAVLWLPLAAGCGAEAALRAGGRNWLWSLVPIVLFAAVQGFGMALDRRRSARREDRRGARLYLAALALVVVATMLFVACNLSVEIPPEGKLANLAAWFAGAAVAAAGGVLVERRAAVAAKDVPPVRLTRRRSR
jgi:hypothetical protein